MVTRANLTSTEVSARRRARERLGLPLPGPGRHRQYDPGEDAALEAAVAAYRLIGEQVDRYTPGDDEAARLVMEHRDGYVVVVDGRIAVHASDEREVVRQVHQCGRFARILPVAECRSTP